jgi:hypothetical protein
MEYAYLCAWNVSWNELRIGEISLGRSGHYSFISVMTH